MGKNKKGVTLVELMITVSVILLALVPLLRLFINANRGNQHLAQMTVAENLIQQTFDEISRKKWDENSISPGEYLTTTLASASSGAPWVTWTVDATENAANKTTFDDMDDYSAILDDTPRDLSGNIIPGYEAYRISVDVKYVTNPRTGVPNVVAGPEDFKKVTIRVSWKGGGANRTTVKEKTRIFYNGVDYTR
ncbi:prepilin-type N-terminal cleavage/methylation domain-containing protein [bacterium]|nr:prepilin-type N-terminal cleavage/methylation domain-containing protein [bacterium]